MVDEREAARKPAMALNQGDQLLAGTFPFATRWWKLPLTFVVPFCVAMYGALSNGYRPSPPTLDKAAR